MAYTNPVLALPAMARMRTLDLESRTVLADVLREIGADADRLADESWKRRKGPMAAYWRAVGVYARHIARAAQLPVVCGRCGLPKDATETDEDGMRSAHESHGGFLPCPHHHQEDWDGCCDRCASQPQHEENR